jgi:hypothetical protein
MKIVEGIRIVLKYKQLNKLYIDNFSDTKKWYARPLIPPKIKTRKACESFNSVNPMYAYRTNTPSW